jgi:hypothetical protein
MRRADTPKQCCERTMSTPLSGRINMGSIRATMVAAFAVFILPFETAHAQFPFWPQYRSWWGHHAPFRHKHHHRHRHTKSESVKSAQINDAPKGSLQIIISVADQRVSLYDDGELIARSSVSTGTQRHPTPLGVFSVIGKQRWHRSNLYSAAPMPYMQRITWSGIALHAGVLPGYPASHGCIRLTNEFAARLWHLTNRGTRVIIAHGDVQPVEITHPQLFKPNAPSGSVESPTAAVPANGNITPATTHEAASLQVPASVPSGVASQKVVPISVFVSRKLHKLFVRRGFTPLFDVPVKIQNPEEPLGTHVFTAMEFQNEGAAMRWTVVSLREELPRMSRGSTKQREAPAKQIIEPTLPVPSSNKANTALDRIEIPQDVVERISGLLTPASSLVISDYGISHETRKDTDFIVVTQ